MQVTRAKDLARESRRRCRRYRTHNKVSEGLVLAANTLLVNVTEWRYFVPQRDDQALDGLVKIAKWSIDDARQAALDA